jgi:PAS domain S-box-containing protein
VSSPQRFKVAQQGLELPVELESKEKPGVVAFPKAKVMKKRGNISLILFFAVLTLVTTGVVILAWERFLRHPFYDWVEQRYPGEKLKQYNIQQRGEHFFISTSVDVIVVTMLLRLVDRQQRKLRRTEERYRAVFEHATDGIGIVDANDSRIVDTNQRFAGMLGYSPDRIVGNDFSAIMNSAVEAPDDKGLRAILSGMASSEVDVSVSRAGAGVFPASISSSSLLMDEDKLVVMIMRDRSERMRLEEEKELMQRQLYQKSKLESLGELSAGVAHEINNPLNCIINFAQLLKDRPRGLEETEIRMVQGIIDEGERIAKIVKNLLTFARRDVHDLGKVDVAETIRNSMSLFGRQLEMDGIKVEIELDNPLPVVIGDASRLRQVVVNMISNGRNALRDKKSSKKLFRITARGLRQGDDEFVTMEFLDNGVGIAQEDLDRVFDPFFTTRRESGGTGLGLSLAFGIVQEYGGTISLDSRKGEFARFVVQIPAAGVKPNGESATGGR